MSVMHSLSNIRHELFAQRVATGSSPDGVYMDLYGTENASSAASAARRLMKNQAVQRRIDHLRQVGALAAGVDDEVIDQMMLRIGKYDPRLLFDKEGQLVPFKNLPDAIAQCIDSIVLEITPTGFQRRIDITFSNKIKALEILADFQIAYMKAQGLKPTDSPEEEDQVSAPYDENLSLEELQRRYEELCQRRPFPRRSWPRRRR